MSALDSLKFYFPIPLWAYDSAVAMPWKNIGAGKYSLSHGPTNPIWVLDGVCVLLLQPLLCAGTERLHLAKSNEHGAGVNE